MKPISLVGIACMLFSAAVACAAEPMDDSKTLQSIEQQWLQATIQSDRATVDSLLNESFFQITPDGRRRPRSEVLNAPPPPAGSMQVLDEMQVHLNGDTATVVGIDHYRASALEPTVNFRFVDTFTRINGVWQVSTSHMTRM